MSYLHSSSEAGTEVALSYLPDPERFRILVDATALMGAKGWGQLDVRAVNSWKELFERARKPLPDIVILDPCAAAPPPLDPDERVKRRRKVARILGAFPRSPVVVYPSPGCLGGHDFLQLGRMGVAAVLNHESGVHYMAARLRSLGGLPAGYAVIDSLADIVSDRYLDLLRKALPVAHRGRDDLGEPKLSVPRLADLWMRGGKTDTLRDHLNKEGLPNAGWMVRWLVVLRAVVLRPFRPTRTCLSAELGFGSADALRWYVRRFTGEGFDDLTSDDLAERFREVALARAKASIQRRKVRR